MATASTAMVPAAASSLAATEASNSGADSDEGGSLVVDGRVDDSDEVADFDDEAKDIGSDD